MVNELWQKTACRAIVDDDLFAAYTASETLLLNRQVNPEKLPLSVDGAIVTPI